MVIGIIAILASLLLPTLARAKSSAKSAACKSNLRQQAIGLQIYVEEYEKYPGDARIPSYAGDPMDAISGLSQLAAFLSPDLFVRDQNGVLYQVIGTHPTVFHCPGRGITNFIGMVAREYGYGYNSFGTLRYSPGVPLGLGPIRFYNASRQMTFLQVGPSDVRVPAEMIAIGDKSDPSHFMLGEIGPYVLGNISRVGAVHNRGANIAFCDGHVEFGKPEHWINATGTMRRRWNNDHEPHPETW